MDFAVRGASNVDALIWLNTENAASPHRHAAARRL